MMIGTTFGAVVKSFADDMSTSMITALGEQPNFSMEMVGPLRTGNVLNAILSLFITAAVVYFVFVLPMSRVIMRVKSSVSSPQLTRACPECLSIIPQAACRCSFCTAQVAPLLIDRSAPVELYVPKCT